MSTLDIQENQLSQATKRLANVLRVDYTQFDYEAGKLRWERYLVDEKKDGTEIYEYTVVMNIKTPSEAVVPNYIFGQRWFRATALINAIEGMIMLYQSMFGSVGNHIPQLDEEGKWRFKK